MTMMTTTIATQMTRLATAQLPSMPDVFPAPIPEGESAPTLTAATEGEHAPAVAAPAEGEPVVPATPIATEPSTTPVDQNQAIENKAAALKEIITGVKTVLGGQMTRTQGDITNLRQAVNFCKNSLDEIKDAMRLYGKSAATGEEVQANKDKCEAKLDSLINIIKSDEPVDVKIGDDICPINFKAFPDLIKSRNQKLADKTKAQLPNVEETLKKYGLLPE